VNLGEGLEEIGAGAFRECSTLHEITIPPTVKAIKDGSFSHCFQIMIANLGEGLEEIGEYADLCASLHEISITRAVEAIKDYEFGRCNELTIVILGEELEEIGEGAFRECTSLQEILIPPAVKVMKDRAFSACSSLTSVVFSDEIEEFVTASSMRDWWNHGTLPEYLLLFSPIQYTKAFGSPSNKRVADQHLWNAEAYSYHPPSIPSRNGCIQSSFFEYHQFQAFLL
jgi:hypothetical protein